MATVELTAAFSTVPAGEFVPPQTCAYQFRLSAQPRITNGYTYFSYVETTKHITLVKPGPVAAGAPEFLEENVLGISGTDGLPAGEEPARLGADTFS